MTPGADRARGLEQKYADFFAILQRRDGTRVIHMWFCITSAQNIVLFLLADDSLGELARGVPRPTQKSLNPKYGHINCPRSGQSSTYMEPYKDIVVYVRSRPPTTDFYLPRTPPASSAKAAFPCDVIASSIHMGATLAGWLKTRSKKKKLHGGLRPCSGKGKGSASFRAFFKQHTQLRQKNRPTQVVSTLLIGFGSTQHD